MIFLPNDDKLAEASLDIIKHVVAKEGQCKIKAWRDVPVDREVVGRLAKLTEPRIVQVTFSPDLAVLFFLLSSMCTSKRSCNFFKS